MARESNITVSYDRVPGYPQENITRNDVTAIDKIRCAWDDRITLAKQLLGYVVGGILYRAHEYDFVGEEIRNIFCKDVTINPLMSLDSSSGAGYEKAELEVLYGFLNYSEPDEGTVYITESLEPASEFLTLSHEGIYWDNAQAEPLGETEAPAKIIRMIDWVYTLHYIGYIPSWVWTHPGSVNNAAVYSRELDVTFNTGTLLCGNPTLSREVTNTGDTSWTITARFTFRWDTWHKFPRTNAAGDLNFVNIYDGAGSIKYVYNTVDFGNIVI